MWFQQPKITSTNKMADSCWRAFNEIKVFACFTILFLFAFGIITCVFIVKQLFAEDEVIICEYSPRLRLGKYSPVITSPSTNNC